MAHAPLHGAGLLGEDRFVDAEDGRRLRAMVAGDGDDLVVLEAGLGLSGLYWGPVHGAIAPRARVLAYERAGFGASTPDPDHPRSLRRLAADLIAVVGAVPHRRLVLVGHSLGGPIVRTAAAVLTAAGSPPAGLLLVDQSDEHALSLYRSRAARWTNAIQGSTGVLLARLHALAPLTRLALGGLPPRLRRATAAASGTVAAARAADAELGHLVAGLTALRDSPPAMDGIPVGVVSGQRSTPLDARMRARIVAAHRETARAHARSRFVPAERSGHLVPLTEPGLVAAEALSLLR